PNLASEEGHLSYTLFIQASRDLGRRNVVPFSKRQLVPLFRFVPAAVKEEDAEGAFCYLQAVEVIPGFVLDAIAEELQRDVARCGSRLELGLRVARQPRANEHPPVRERRGD